MTVIRQNDEMDGAIGAEPVDRSAFIAEVWSDLIDLRGDFGQLTPQKFAAHKALRRVCGGDDLLDAYLMFERELRRYKTSGRNEAAAAISIDAPADTVLDRLEHVAGALPKNGAIRDQRTARRWSDEGLRTIASDLVYFAEVQGRLGRELLSIEVRGGSDGMLHLLIDQMTNDALDATAPLVRLWHYLDGEPEEHPLSLDLESVPAPTASRGGNIMKRYRIAVELPRGVRREDGDPLLGVSTEGRDAPMRTVSIEDRTSLPEHLSIRFSVYRTIASIEVI